MSFVKLESVMKTSVKDGNDNWMYKPDTSIILNTSQILSIELIQKEAALINDECKEKYERYFDMKSSELCILRIFIIDRPNTSYYYIIAPYKKFEEFK